jgi:hypothetical protein
VAYRLPSEKYQATVWQDLSGILIASRRIQTDERAALRWRVAVAVSAARGCRLGGRHCR